MRLGWCDECNTRGTQADSLDLSLVLYPAIVSIVGAILAYVLLSPILVAQP